MDKSIDIVPVLFEKNTDCCGCYACYSICPRGAISMREDKEGFEYPYTDANKCIRCRQCLDVCPIKQYNPDTI